jgi:ubiquinone/menaquinone biosynthesis C-methylase UbiE
VLGYTGGKRIEIKNFFGKVCLKNSSQLLFQGMFMEKRKDFFDRHASSWDKDLGYEDGAARLEEVVKWFNLSQQDSVLDVGTGTGILLPFLREAIGPKGRLIAIDFSFKMLEKAKTRHFPGEKNIINASVAAIPFRSDQFDRVTCFSAFPHFPNKSWALLEMVRVLKSGGTLFIAHLHSVEEINQFHQAVGGPVAHDFLPHPERIRSLMKESGLDEVSILNQPGKFFAQGKKI